MNEPEGLVGERAVVLDTSVVSLIVKEDPAAEFYKRRVDGYQAWISFQTLEELQFGAEKAGWGRERRFDLREHVKQYRTIWPSNRLVLLCARLRAERERAGRRLGTADAWIAATAILLGCPLASHDRDFSGIPNLRVIQSR